MTWTRVREGQELLETFSLFILIIKLKIFKFSVELAVIK
jgi:hypothetical protein